MICKKCKRPVTRDNSGNLTSLRTGTWCVNEGSHEVDNGGVAAVCIAKPCLAEAGGCANDGQRTCYLTYRDQEPLESWEK